MKNVVISIAVLVFLLAWVIGGAYLVYLGLVFWLVRWWVQLAIVVAALGLWCYLPQRLAKRYW